MKTIASLDPQSKPFANRAWSHTAVNSCAWNLLNKELGTPERGRPDRFVSIKRRDEGSLQHDAADLAMIALGKRGIWPDPLAVIRRFASKYPMLAGDEVAMAEKHKRWQERFTFDMDRMVAREWKVAITAEGELCNYDDPLPGAWRVRIDWAEASKEGQLRVIDYKNKPHIDTDMQLKRHEQLAGYAYALGQMNPKWRRMPVKIGVYYFEYGVTKEVELEWTEIDKLFAMQMAKASARASLRVIDIVPEPGFGKCQYCEYLMDCPAGSDLMAKEQAAPTDLAGAIELAKKTFVLEEILESAKASLKEYAQHFGPIPVDDTMGYGFKLGSSNRIGSLAELIVDLKNAEIPLEDVLTLNLVAGKKLAKDNKFLEGIIEKHVKRVEDKTTFQAYRPKDHKTLTVAKISTKVKKKEDKEATPKKPKAKKGANAVTTVATIK